MNVLQVKDNVQEVHDLGLETNTNMLEIKDSFREVRDEAHLAKLEAERNALRRRLSAPDPSTNHDRAQRSRHSGTGSWLVTSDHFTRWEQQRAAI